MFEEDPDKNELDAFDKLCLGMVVLILIIFISQLMHYCQQFHR